MELGETKFAFIDEMHARATRDIESFTRTHNDIADSLTATMAPVTESLSSLARIFTPVLEQQKEMQDRIAEAIAPITRARAEIQRAMQPYLEKATRAQEMMERITKGVTLPSISPSGMFEGEVMYLARPVHTTVRLADESMDMIVNKVVAVLKTEQHIIIDQKENATPKAMVTMPAGATWDHTELRFADAHTLRVLYKEKLMGQYDYATLGFARKNTKEGLSDKQWDFLTQLSILTEMKSAKPTKRNLSSQLGITPSACEKVKEKLSKKLQVAFGISDDPFKKYDSIEGYRPTFILKPEPLLRGDGEVHRSGGSLMGWKDYGEDSAEDLLD